MKKGNFHASLFNCDVFSGGADFCFRHNGQPRQDRPDTRVPSKNVGDRAAYGKSFGRALLVMAAGMLLSSVTSLIGYPKPAVAILVVGLIIGIVMLVAVQIKHNGGIF